jgi:hypothetical protein
MRVLEAEGGRARVRRRVATALAEPCPSGRGCGLLVARTKSVGHTLDTPRELRIWALVSAKAIID